MPKPFSKAPRQVLARMQWWAMLAPRAEAQPVDVLIYGNIGDGWWSDGPSTTALGMVQQIQEIGAQPLNVRINSYGGSIADGIAIYNALKNHPAPVSVTVDGFAVSIASLVAMAGKSLRMYPGSMLMIHAPWTAVGGNAAQLRAVADGLDAQAQSMAACYTAKSGQKADAVMGMLTDGNDHWLTAAQSVEAGYCNLILNDPESEPDPEDPEEAAETEDPMQMAAAVFGAVPFDLSRFKNFPAAAAAMSQEMSMKFRNIAKKYFAQAGGDGSAAGGTVNPNPAPAAAAADPAGAQAAAAAALNERNGQITQAFAAFRTRNGIAELERACLADATVTAAQARERLLVKLGEGAEPAGGAHVAIVADARDKFFAGSMAALLARGNIEKPKTENGNEFRGFSLLELARESLRAQGREIKTMDKLGVIAAAFTTPSDQPLRGAPIPSYLRSLGAQFSYTGSDFTLLLANIAEKALLKGYIEAGETFQEWTTKGTLPDFKQAIRADITQFPALDLVEDGAEYKTVQGVGDRGQYIQLATYGKLFAITRQTIINDDLNAMTRVPMYMGRAAVRTVGNLVYAILTGNPNLRDTHPLFYDRTSLGAVNNILIAAGILTASVDAMRVAMRTQNENGAILNLPLKKLLVPVNLGGQARTVRDSQYQVDAITSAKSSQNTIPNSVRGIFDVVEDARLDNFDPLCWFGTADPAFTDTIEVAYLDGNSEPFLEQQLGWTIDGTQYKVRLDAGVSPLDFRTMFKNPGH